MTKQKILNYMTYLTQIRTQIANGELSLAIQSLLTILYNSPKLDEAVQQSARFQAINQQIRLGIIGNEEATLSKNQITWGILELLRNLEQNQDSIALNSILDEIENQSKDHELQKELQAAAKTIIQNAEKIYNIEKIDNANFS